MHLRALIAEAPAEMIAPARTDDPTELIARFGRRIRERRKLAGLSQRRVAERLRIKVSNYQRIEAGRQNVTLRTVALIAAAVGARPHDLLAPIEEERSHR